MPSGRIKIHESDKPFWRAIAETERRVLAEALETYPTYRAAARGVGLELAAFRRKVKRYGLSKKPAPPRAPRERTRKRRRFYKVQGGSLPPKPAPSPADESSGPSGTDSPPAAPIPDWLMAELSSSDPPDQDG